MFRRTAAPSTTMHDTDFNDWTTTLGVLLLAALAALVALSGCRNVTPADEPDDTAPSFGDATVADQTYSVGVEIEPLQLPAATGGDGELTYALAPAVPGLSFDAATRTLSGTPGEAGKHEMTYTATDADDNTDAADAATLTFTIAVEIDPDNRAPYVTFQITARTLHVKEGPGRRTVAVSFILPDYFADPDDDPLTFTASSSNEAVATAVVGPQPYIEETEDVLRVESVGLGDATITVTATDPSGASASQEFTVSVVEPNRPPHVIRPMTAPPLQVSGVRGGAIAVSFILPDYFADPDDDPLTFTASSSDEAVVTAVVGPLPEVAPEGEEVLEVAAVGLGQATITVTATDPSGASATQEFTVWVVEPGEPGEPDISNTYRGHGDEVFHLNPDGAPLVDAGYALELGSASPEVYLIATNTNAYRTNSTIEWVGFDAGRAPDISGAVDESRLWQRSGPRAWRPEVSEFNNNPPLGRAVAPGVSYSRPSRSQAGDRHTFLDLDSAWNLVTVPATARRVVDDGTRTLTVWVADASWGTGCALSACVQQAMVDAIAERFLRSGAGNDIHDWIVAVFGDPWGPHEKDYLIPPEAASELHILVFDIDGDDEEGGAVAFFWAKDAFVRDPSSALPLKASNERLMFYVDAVWLATPDDSTWNVTDYSPSTTIAALAHEFQHMIHYYQKSVMNNALSETWLNEMASEVAEDLIADKLSVHGPRGVLDDPSAGDPENWRGRLPVYNFFNYVQVTAWDYEVVYQHYAISYALGAYLARTYGGAELFGDIVQSRYSGIDAIEAALRGQGHAASFGDVLMHWAAANLVSDNMAAPAPYRYNSGTWSTSHAGGQTYRLGSINLYNYRWYYDEGPDDYWDGPRMYRFSQFEEGLVHRPHANAYTTLGRATGTVRLRIDTDAGNRITVVVKE